MQERKTTSSVRGPCAKYTRSACRSLFDERDQTHHDQVPQPLPSTILGFSCSPTPSSLSGHPSAKPGDVQAARKQAGGQPQRQGDERPELLEGGREGEAEQAMQRGKGRRRRGDGEVANEVRDRECRGQRRERYGAEASADDCWVVPVPGLICWWLRCSCSVCCWRRRCSCCQVDWRHGGLRRRELDARVGQKVHGSDVGGGEG